MQQALVTRFELWLLIGGAWALWLAALLRTGWGYAVSRHLWLLDTQIAAGCLLLCVLYCVGTFIPRTYSAVASLIVGGAAWLLALSLLPRNGWPVTPLADWLLVYCGAMLLLALLLRAILRQRWLAQLRGHGFAWMQEWAAERSLYARTLTVKVMRGLGYRPD